MAAQEEEHEGVVVGDGALVPGDRGRLAGDQLALRAGRLAAAMVDEPALGGRQEPAVGRRRDAVARPVIGGGEQRLLDGVLGSVEVARAARQRAEDPRREVAQQVLDGGGAQIGCPAACSRNAPISAAVDGASSMTWRTMIGCWMGTPPWPGTADTRAAISTARASDSTSTIW